MESGLDLQVKVTIKYKQEIKRSRATSPNPKPNPTPTQMLNLPLLLRHVKYPDFEDQCENIELWQNPSQFCKIKVSYDLGFFHDPCQSLTMHKSRKSNPD